MKIDCSIQITCPNCGYKDCIINWIGCEFINEGCPECDSYSFEKTKEYKEIVKPITKLIKKLFKEITTKEIGWDLAYLICFLLKADKMADLDLTINNANKKHLELIISYFLDNFTFGCKLYDNYEEKEYLKKTLKNIIDNIEDYNLKEVKKFIKELH